MTGNASTTLPAFVQAVIDAADESETFTVPDGVENAHGTATFARQGAMNIRIGHTAEEMSWHSHDSEDEARECYAAVTQHARESMTYLANGGDGRVLALANQTGMPVEVAEMMLPQILAQMEGEPTIPVPAVERAQAPQAVDVDLGPDAPWTGMYL